MTSARTKAQTASTNSGDSSSAPRQESLKRVTKSPGQRRSALKREVTHLLEHSDFTGLVALAQAEGDRVLRLVLRSLYSADSAKKFRAVGALGALVQQRQGFAEDKVREMLRRFVWALNDESGAVPYGIAEAMGEVLYQRPELQADFLPILCSLLVQSEFSQTGAIEQGAVWAVSRVGKVCFAVEPRLLAVLQHMLQNHADKTTCALAKQALATAI